MIVVDRWHESSEPLEPSAPNRRLLFLSRPPPTTEGELDEQELDAWSTELAQVVWPLMPTTDVDPSEGAST